MFWRDVCNHSFYGHTDRRCIYCQGDMKKANEHDKKIRHDERKKVREIIETKIKNDPENPVLLTGLKYVLVILSHLNTE